MASHVRKQNMVLSGRSTCSQGSLVDRCGTVARVCIQLCGMIAWVIQGSRPCVGCAYSK